MLAIATRRGGSAGIARRKLWCGTALAMCMSVAGPALAQTLPVVSNAGGATVTTGGQTMSVDINGANRVVTYSSFNLGTTTSSSETLTFLNSGAAGSYSVLNRVTAGTGSKIYGSISSPSDITVWLVDPMGVTFGPTGSFSGGGLIVSTALLSGADQTSFLAGTLNALNGASTAPIVFQSGSGAISASGSIAVVGQQIAVNKSISSSTGAVALVAATDVSFTNINSPLSFTVSRGTTLATGVTVSGTGTTVSGQSVRLAGGVDGVVTAALLQVDPNTTISATAANGSILLSTATGNGVTIANGGLTPGLTTSGTLQATGANADIAIVGAGAVTVAGSLVAGRDVSLSSIDAAAGIVTAGGGVTAGRDYAVSARSVVLGAAATSLSQQAGGAITVTGGAGNIAGLGSLTLQSNTDGVGAETLTLDTQTGLINLAGTTALIGGTAANRSDVALRSASSITAGNVTARAVLSVGNPTDLTVPGSVTVGDVTVDSALRITSGGSIQGGALVSNNGAIRLDAQAAGSVTAQTLNAAGAIDVLANTDVRLTSAQSSAGSIGITSQNGNVTGLALGSPASDGRPLVNFGRTDLTAGGAGQTITVTASNGTAQLGALSAGSSASALGANQILVSAQAIDLLGATAANGHVDLEASTGAIRARTLSAGSATALADVVLNSALGAVTIDGAVSASRDYRVTGSVVTLGATSTTVTQAANGSVTIRANSGNITGLGALTLQSNQDGAGAETLYLNAAGVASAVNFSTGSTLLGGLPGGTAAQRSDVLITSASPLVLGNVTANSLRTFGNATDLVSAGAITTGNVTVDQSLRFASNAGSISTGNIESKTGSVRLDAQAAGSVTAGTVKAANAIDLLANTNIRLVSADATAGSIRLAATLGGISTSASGKIDLTANGAGQTIQVTAGGAALLGTLSAGSGAGALGADQLSVTAGSIDLDDATAVNGNIHLIATGGTLRAGALSAGTPTILADVIASASGAATLFGDVIASRDFTATGSAVTLGNASGAVTQSAGRTITATATAGDILGFADLSLESGLDTILGATGTATMGGNVTALRDYSVTGTSVTLGNATGSTTQSAGGSLAVTATNGDITGLANLSLLSTLDATFGATGAVALRGSVAASGDYSVTGASASLGNGASAVSQSAGGLLTITTTSGDIAGAAGLLLQSGGNATFSAAGAANLQGGVSATGDYSVTGTGVSLGGTGAAVTQSAGGFVSVTATAGDITGLANLLLQSGTDTTLSATGAANLQGSVSATGNYSVTGASVSLGGTGAAVTQSAGGFVSVTATAGDITGLANLSLESGTDTTFGATGAVVLRGGVAASGDYRVTGASATLGNGASAVTQSAGGLLTITASSGDIAGATGLLLQSGGDATFSAAGAASLQGNVAATGNYSVTATSVTLGTAGTSVTQSSGGLLTIAATGGDILGLADLSLQSTLDSSFSATGTATIRGAVSALRDYSVSGSSVTLGNAGTAVVQSAGRNLTVTATSGDITGLTGLTLQSNGDATFGAPGTVLLPGDITASGTYVVTGASVTLGNMTTQATQAAGGLVTITATGGDITGLGQLLLQSNSDGIGTEALTLDATGIVTFAPSSSILAGLATGPASGRGDVLIRSAPSLSLGTVTGRALRSIGNATDLVVAGAVLTGDVTVDQALAVQTTNGSITTGAVTVLGGGESLRLSAGGAASDLTSGALQTNGGDILLTAGRDISVGAIATAPSGTPVTGTIALLAGREILASTLAAGEDIALSGGGNLTFTTASAGDDIDIATTGTVSLVSAISSGAGVDARAVQLDRTLAGQPGAIAFAGAGSQTGHNLTIRAAALTSPVALVGDTDAGLVVRNLTSGAQTVTADRGDIRLGALDATGDVDVTASQGSISGLRDGWTSTSGGATLQAPGAIVLDGVGAANFAIGSVTAASVSTGATAPYTLRLGTVHADSVDLTAGSNLQIDDAQVTGTVQLRTTGGTAAAFNLTDPTLAAGYGRATIGATNDIDLAAFGAAQLDTVSAGGNIAVNAAAIDVDTATALNGALSLTATSGRLTLGSGIAGTTASLIKEDADIGLPKTAADNLLTAGNVTAGAGASFRSATSATIGTATTASGDLTVNAANDATIGTGTANAGAALILAGHDVSATTLTAEDVAMRAGNDATLGTLSAGDNVTLDAAGLLTIGSASASGTGTDNRGFVLDTALAGQAGAITVAATPAADGDIRATGGSGVRLGLLESTLGNIAVTAATGDITGPLADPANGSLVVHAAGKSITVSATGGTVQLGPLSAGQGSSSLTGTQIGVTARSIDLQSATATNGALSLIATDGNLTLGTGTAATSATLIARGATGELSVTGTLSAGQDIAIQSVTNARLGSIVSSAGSIGVIAQSEVTGIAGGNAALTAFEDVAISAGGAVRLGAVKAGDDISIDTAGSVYLVSAITDGNAGSDARTIVFDRSQIGQAAGVSFRSTASLATQPPAGSNIAIRAASLGGPALTGDTDAGLVVGTLTGGSLALAAAQGDIRADSLTATTGDIAATATKGSISGRRSGFQSGSGGATISANGQVAFDVTGSVTAGAVTAGTQVTTAGGATPDSIHLRSVNAGALTLNAGTGLQVDSGTVSGAVSLGTAGGSASGSVSGYGAAAMDAQAAGKSITIDAAGAAQLDAIQAGQGATTAAGNQITIRADSARIGSARAGNGDMLIEAKTGLALLGAVQAGDARTVTIRNTGTGGTIVGGTTAGGTGIALDDSEMDLITAGNVVIDSKAQPLTIQKLTIASGTGKTSLRLLTTGAIELTDMISGDGTGTLQIGGSAIDDPDGLVDPAKLATQLKADIGDSGTKGAILLPNGTVDLRAQKIVFARPHLIDKYLPASGASPSNATVAFDVANAASELYTSDGTGRVFLTAKTLKVSYSDFALFQNTAAASGGGVTLNEVSPPSITALALQLFSTGDRADNSFALFGHINGFFGRAAGILPNESIQFASIGGNPRITRIAQGNSRLNGCVIGSPDKGCLVTDPPRPNFSIYDQRQTQLFGMADDPLLFFNPLVGRGNEGLIVDIADAPVGIDTIECDPSKGPCTTGAPK
ncbi:MAG: filamentous hemagglutinin N-terminal domain-containing protein [Sphingomonas sp.]